MGKEAEDGAFLVGLEIHQQLACGTKLFCACPPVKSAEFPYHFERRLRPAQSETGRVDPAAVFEFSKSKSISYFWSPESSCLVEADEEPPHPLSSEALDSVLVISRTLKASVVDEVHVMRKIVIDGSNTAGFQRTSVVGLGGYIQVEGTRVGVQSVTVEEDAARILGEDASSRSYGLDRLGVALVEIALDPVRGDPEFVGKVALYLGRVLRSTGRVARGLGTIRQDLNVSYRGGKVVEVKGVQKLNLLPKVVEYERKRQEGLVQVSEKLAGRGVREVICTVKEVTSELASSSSRVVRGQISAGGKAVAITASGLGGLLGWEPSPGIRLGKELAEVARANSLGGIIHSDEFEKQGIGHSEVEMLRSLTGSGPGDALIILAGPRELVDPCVPNIIARAQAAIDGVPAETRAATDAGETRYMRPRPGSQRMYPETDIPDIVITTGRLRQLSRGVPENWEERVTRLARKWSISSDLALKVYDAELEEDFARMSDRLKLEPSIIASVLVDIPPRMARDGVPEEALALEVLEAVLGAVSDGRAAKEAIPEILKRLGTEGGSVDGAIEALGLEAADESTVDSVIRAVLERNAEIIAEKGDRAFSPLMGEAMKELRGKADGAAVGRRLRAALAEKGRSQAAQS